MSSAAKDNPPVASNVNFYPGSVAPNVAAAPIGPDGQACYTNRISAVELVADHLATVHQNAITLTTPTGAPSRRVDIRLT